MSAVVWIADLYDKGWGLSKTVHAIQSEQKTSGTEESPGRLRPLQRSSGTPHDMLKSLPPTACESFQLRLCLASLETHLAPCPRKMLSQQAKKLRLAEGPPSSACF